MMRAYLQVFSLGAMRRMTGALRRARSTRQEGTEYQLRHVLGHDAPVPEGERMSHRAVGREAVGGPATEWDAGCRISERFTLSYHSTRGGRPLYILTDRSTGRAWGPYPQAGVRHIIETERDNRYLNVWSVSPRW